MSTFKSTACNSTRSLEVRSQTDLGRGVGLFVRRSDGGGVGIDLDPADVPALALAVLEAAGVHRTGRNLRPEDTSLTELAEMATYLLAERERRAAEQAAADAEEAALEAEAEVLYQEIGLVPAWHEAPEEYRNKWIAVARRARELAKERAK